MARIYIPKLISQVAWGAGIALAGTGMAFAQAQCVSQYQTFTSDNDTFAAPSTGYYWIEASGAEGNDRDINGAPDVDGGRGAIVGGKFHLEEGTTLYLRVGKKPGSDGGGGGGGTFVSMGAPTPTFLVVAGGGGGGQSNSLSSRHGQDVTPNGAGGAGATGPGGVNGQGGGRSNNTRGGAGGGGISGDGANGLTGASALNNTGGKAWANNSAGGTGTGQQYHGGFGGGGAGVGTGTGGFNGGGGGGGGYSGGGSGGGGGGSFIASTLYSTSVGNNGRLNNGQVRICADTPAANLAAPTTPHFAVTESAYTATTLAASGGIGPYTYAWTTSGPDGITLTNGVLEGTAAEGQAGSYSITVTDSAVPFANTTTVSLLVIDPLESNAPTTATELESYSLTMEATGGVAPYEWSQTNLPASLQLSASGEISGTPAAGSNGTYTLTVTDSALPTANTYTVDLEIVVPALEIITTGSLPDATQGVQYDAYLEATGGDGTYYWSTSPLPNGLTLTGNHISGYPTAPGQHIITLTVSDGEISPTSVARKATQTTQVTLNVLAPAPSAAVPVPTLGEWSVALLAALVAGFGLRQSRRKQRA